jgi:excisionase family DNA binding protein
MALTMQDLEDRTTVSVEEAATVLGISRRTAYEAIHRGEIPVLRLGRRMVVPVPKLKKMIGVEPTPSS